MSSESDILDRVFFGVHPLEGEPLEIKLDMTQDIASRADLRQRGIISSYVVIPGEPNSSFSGLAIDGRGTSTFTGDIQTSDWNG